MGAVAALILGTQAFASVKLVKKVELTTPSSFSCYTDEQEKTGSTSSVSFYVGKYTVDAEGKKTFSYYSSSLTSYTTAEMCRTLKLIYSTIDVTSNYELSASTVYIDENDRLVGADDPIRKALLILE